MFENLFKLFELLSRSSAAITLTALGVFLLLAGMIALSRIITLKPSETPGWLNGLTATCFVLGVLFAAAGPAIALLNIKVNPIDKLSPKEAWSKLKENREVKWLIRLIAYNPKDPKEKNLSIGRLKKLGPDDVDYTFVGVYDELKGYTVKNALEMVGVTFDGEYRVSAIIFPILRSMEIIPANARGLLQVIQDLEATHPEFTNTIVNTRNFSQEKINHLKNNRSMADWNFSHWQPDYNDFCQITLNAICSMETGSNIVDAFKLISKINRDWHPAGGAIIRRNKIDPCKAVGEYCATSNWDDIEKDIEKPVGNRFGARIFLIKNVELENLNNRYLIDFGNPNQLIPEIGAE